MKANCCFIVHWNFPLALLDLSYHSRYIWSSLVCSLVRALICKDHWMIQHISDITETEVELYHRIKCSVLLCNSDSERVFEQTII